MMNRATRTRQRLDVLMTLARAKSIQVHEVDAAAIPGLGVGWKGLYLLTKELGPGIALRKGLSPEDKVWTLAHEIAHDRAPVTLSLLSPFESSGLAAALLADTNCARRRDPAESLADEDAANMLIEPGEWKAAERKHPVDLRRIAKHLHLPLAAALAWDRRRRKLHRSVTIEIPIGASIRERLSNATEGNGGHQSLFRRVVRPRRLLLNLSDFSLARERVLSVKGGWLSKYETILEVALPVIKKAGGIANLFVLPQ